MRRIMVLLAAVALMAAMVAASAETALADESEQEWASIQYNDGCEQDGFAYDCSGGLPPCY
jgi:hypothetical protein